MFVLVLVNEAQSLAEKVGAYVDVCVTVALCIFRLHLHQ